LHIIETASHFEGISSKAFRPESKHHQNSLNSMLQLGNIQIISAFKTILLGIFTSFSDYLQDIILPSQIKSVDLTSTHQFMNRLCTNNQSSSPIKAKPSQTSNDKEQKVEFSDRLEKGVKLN
jgi:hypothetical protein